MFSILVILFTLVPAIEIYLLFKIGGEIGGLNTLLIVIATGVVGAALAKTQGIVILNKIQSEMQKGGLPTNQLIQGLMVFAGGLLLLTPGFATDIFGFSLVMPGTRHLLMIWVKKALERSMKNGSFNFQTFTSARSSDGKFYSYTSNNFSQEQDLFSNQHDANKTIEGDIIEAEFKHKD